MATADTKQLLLRIDASTELLRRNIAQADGVVAGFAQRAEGGANRIDRAFASVGNNFRNLVGGLSAAVAVRGFIELADQSKAITSQLKLATASFGSFGQAQKDSERIASVTRNGLSETASLYGNFVRSSQALGKTQEDAARATESFSKALKIGGADTNAAASATLQFGQALASGVLRGDEFNSIMEASPRIARLLADSLGIPVGQLRAMAEQGQLTSEVLYRALTDTKFTAGLDAEFKQLPVTFGEAMTALNNAAITTFGAFDRGGEFSTMLANFVTDGGQGFAGLEKSGEHFGIEVRAVLAGLSDAFAPLKEAGEAVFAFLEGRAAGAGINISRDIQKSLDDVDALTGFLADRANNSALTGFLFNGSAQGTDFGGRNRRGAQKARDDRAAELRDQEINDRFSLRSFRTSPAKPAVTAPTGGKTKAAAKKAAIDYGPDLRNLDPAAGFGFNRLEGLGDPDISGYLKAVQEGIDKQRDAEADLFRQGESRVRDLAGLFEDALTGRAGSFWSQFKQLGLGVVSQIAARLLTANGGAGGGFGSILKSSASSVLGGLFSGRGFAAGGDPPVGKFSLVGERGPELFIPKVPGTIIPNHALGGGAPRTLSMTMTVTGVSNRAEMEAIGIRAGQAAYQAAVATQGKTLQALGRPQLASSMG